MSDRDYFSHARWLKGTSVSYNPPSLAPNTSSSTTIAVAGAVVGDVVLLALLPAQAQVDFIWQAHVSSANTVTVQFYNASDTATTDLAPATITVYVLHFGDS